MRTIITLSVMLASIAPALADPCEAPLPAKGTPFSGPVTYIVDGDGLCVRTAQGDVEVRVADFRACELNEPGGAEAKQIMASIAQGKVAQCVAGDRSYDRTVAVCTIDGKSIGQLLRERKACEGGR